MKYDIVVAGVGGQGILTIASIITQAANMDELYVKQSEIHGLSQRGGQVYAFVRLADHTIFSDIIPLSTADMILSMEPLESLRYLPFLAEDGIVITAKDPILNIPDYLDLNLIHDQIKAIKNSLIIDTEELSKNSKLPKASNIILIEAASSYLPIKSESLASIVSNFLQKLS